MSWRDFNKVISPFKLMELLSELPENVTVEVNAVGNLRICDKETGQYLGYIDLGEESIELVKA